MINQRNRLLPFTTVFAVGALALAALALRTDSTSGHAIAATALAYAQSPTQAPPDVKAPPSDAKKTASGLAYKVLKPGAGKRHPQASSEVTVHYSGWTTDGKLFDSSVTSGQPATFPLNGVIKGWTEGVQLMVEGEKTRFWIPENLAYGGRRPPFGMLVFDIELLKIN
jgi:peptidylprolyl isomerase